MHKSVFWLSWSTKMNLSFQIAYMPIYILKEDAVLECFWGATSWAKEEGRNKDGKELFKKVKEHEENIFNKVKRTDWEEYYISILNGLLRKLDELGALV